MWFTNIILTRARISIILLLLISVRLIPFNLLHFHHYQFAAFEMFSGIIGHQPTAETINNYTPSCSFDKFLSLTGTGFVLGISNNLIEPACYDIGTTALLEIRSTQLLFDILNKGSPQLA